MATIDPFTSEGAKQIAAIAGQQPAPISADVLNTPKLPPLPQPPVPAPVTTPTIPSISDILGSTTTDTPLSKAFTDSTIATANTSAALAGETGYRSTQEQTYGIADKKATVNDLTNRFNTLKAQSDQIPLQIQQDFAGRGATAGGVAPIQTGQLRENAIQQIGISAMLNAANGNLSTAQDQVDYAVKAKFDPLKAELAAQTAQLAAITPLLAREDKKRAEAQSALLDERSRLLTKQESDQKSIYQTMLAAAQTGATASALRDIQNAPTPEAAAALAAPFLGQEYVDKQKQQKFENDLAVLKTQIDQQQANTAARKTSTDGATGMNSLASTVLANPELYNQLTPTEKAKLAPSLAAAGFNAFGKPLDSTAITAINQTDFALTSLADLKTKLQANLQYVGPIKGLAALNPFSKARQIQADVNRVRQTVGKALEGGVLRKEDEEKYKLILATLTDTPETAIYKIDALGSSIQQNLADYKALQSAAGRSDLSKPSLNAADLRSKYGY